MRASISKVEYYSEEYRRLKTRNSYTICYASDEDDAVRYGHVQYFLSLTHQTVAVIHPLTPTSDFCYPQQLSELRQCIVLVSVESSICVISVQSVLSKCVYVS